MTDANTAPPPRTKLSILRRLRRDYPVLLLAVPGMLIICAFHYYPLWGNVIAFQDYQPYLGIKQSLWSESTISRSSSTVIRPS